MRTPVDPCPFCEGLSMFVFDVDGLAANLKQIVCSSCGAAGPYAVTENEAVGKWNYRPDAGYANGMLSG